MLLPTFFVCSTNSWLIWNRTQLRLYPDQLVEFFFKAVSHPFIECSLCGRRALDNVITALVDFILWLSCVVDVCWVLLQDTFFS